MVARAEISTQTGRKGRTRSHTWRRRKAEAERPNDVKRSQHLGCSLHTTPHMPSQSFLTRTAISRGWQHLGHSHLALPCCSQTKFQSRCDSHGHITWGFFTVLNSHYTLICNTQQECCRINQITPDRKQEIRPQHRFGPLPKHHLLSKQSSSEAPSPAC